MTTKHWRAGCALVSTLLLLAACKDPASKPATPPPAPAAPTAPEAANRAIIEALRQRDGVPGEIIEVTHEQRDGHAVSCGLYRAAPPATDKMGFAFGYVDGHLVTAEGPETQAAVACLTEHDHMPAQ